MTTVLLHKYDGCSMCRDARLRIREIKATLWCHTDELDASVIRLGLWLLEHNFVPGHMAWSELPEVCNELGGLEAVHPHEILPGTKEEGS